MREKIKISAVVVILYTVLFLAGIICLPLLLMYSLLKRLDYEESTDVTTDFEPGGSEWNYHQS